MRVTNLIRLNRCLLDFTARYLRGNVLKIYERRNIFKQTLLFNSAFREQRLVFKIIFIVIKLLQVSISSHSLHQVFRIENNMV